jgi:hypothetical protein
LTLDLPRIGGEIVDKIRLSTILSASRLRGKSRVRCVLVSAIAVTALGAGAHTDAAMVDRPVHAVEGVAGGGQSAFTGIPCAQAQLDFHQARFGAGQ